MRTFFYAFLLGGSAYVLIELLWRGRSHVSMFIDGGLVFAILYRLFTRYSMPLYFECLSGALLITAVEFITGYIVNLRMGLKVWDYSSFRFNLYGQICLAYSLAWIFVSLLAAGLCNLIGNYL